MSNELMPIEDFAQLPAEQFGDDVFNTIASPGQFWPRLQIMASNSDAVKSEKVSKGGIWALVRGRDKFEELGKEVIVGVFGWRPKAMDLTKGSFTVYDPNSSAFKDIVQKANVPKAQNYMYGPEFLCMLESHEFCTYHMNSKTARNRATNLRDLINKVALLGVELIKNTQYSWHGPTVEPCSTPISMPTREVYMAELDRFRNPPAEDLVEEDEEEGTGRVT